MAVTTMYFPFGEALRRSRTDKWTLAFDLPYCSSSSGRMPASAAIWLIGSGVAAWAISISLGTGVRSLASLWGIFGELFFGVCSGLWRQGRRHAADLNQHLRMFRAAVAIEEI